jgi:hypothetical protein
VYRKSKTPGSRWDSPCYGVAKSTFGTSLTDGGSLKKSPSDLKPKKLATRLLGKDSSQTGAKPRRGGKTTTDLKSATTLNSAEVNALKDGVNEFFKKVDE